MYQLLDATGEFASFDNLSSSDLTINREKVKVTARTICSVQQSCYGPDSLIIVKIKPFPDSNFNVIAWTFELKQDIRTHPIQGHYDIDVNDITTDEEGNVYILLQIERWDFQFCTDCADAFIDAYSMIYKLNAQGDLQGHVKLNTTTAVVSHMQFLSVANGDIIIRENDINAAGNEVLTTVYHTDYFLVLKDEFNLDRQYNYLVADANLNIYGVTNVYDIYDPNIKGESDVLVTKFNISGLQEWKSYYGGTSFDFPKGMVLTSNGGLAFFANTESTDFDVEMNHGFEDMWLVKLREEITGVDDQEELNISFYPNPTFDQITFSNAEGVVQVIVGDMTGKQLFKQTLNASNNTISVEGLARGTYFLHVTDTKQNRGVYKFVKL